MLNLLFLLLLLQLNGLNCDSVQKIYMDPLTRLSTGRGDGRVHVFHGVAAENSAPPWTLDVYSDEQIEAMKSVNNNNEV